MIPSDDDELVALADDVLDGLVWCDGCGAWVEENTVAEGLCVDCVSVLP